MNSANDFDLPPSYINILKVSVVVNARIIAKHIETDTFDIFIPAETRNDEADDAMDTSEDSFGATSVQEDALQMHASELLQLESGNTPPKEFKERASSLKRLHRPSFFHAIHRTAHEATPERGEVEYVTVSPLRLLIRMSLLRLIVLCISASHRCALSSSPFPPSLFLPSFPPRYNVSRERINYKGKSYASILSSLTFDNLVLLCIIASSVLLAVENPLEEPDSAPVWILWSLNLFFNVFFTIEAGLKVFAWGFILGKQAYVTTLPSF